MAVQAHATAKYVRTSAQKAGLVLDLIRGRDVNHALATLQFARKGDRARHREGAALGDRQRAAARTGSAATSIGCSSTACYANQGPSQKRIRPAPMGRAFRVVKRTAHLTVQVAERPVKLVVRREPRAARASEAAAAAPGREAAGEDGRAESAGEARRAQARVEGCKAETRTEERRWDRKFIRTDSGSASTRRGARAGSPTRTTRSCCTRT